MKKIISFFLLSLGINFLITYSTLLIFPKNPLHFPYYTMLEWYHMPQFLSVFANFDGAHYIRIASIGYEKYEQAFFPLYPILIHVSATFLQKNYLLAGLTISMVSFFVGLVITNKVIQILFPNTNSSWFFALLLSFPSSFFFQSVYTEGLFYLFFLSFLYLLLKKKYFFVGVIAAFSSAIRLQGVFFIVPLFFSLFQTVRQKKSSRIFLLFLFVFTPLIGVLAYAWYLSVSVGDPLFFYHAQQAFGNNRSTHLIFFPQIIYRYIKIILTFHYNFPYVLSIFELGMFLFLFGILLADLVSLVLKKRGPYFYELLGINIFSFINLLLPTLTGTFSSIPRYGLFSVSVFFYLFQIKNKWVKSLFVGLFSIFHMLMLGAFALGYFVS